jgi:hypothetical protein
VFRVECVAEPVGVGVEQGLHLLVEGHFVLPEPVCDGVPVLAPCGLALGVVPGFGRAGGEVILALGWVQM